jgi:hypothetical protein
MTIQCMSAQLSHIDNAELSRLVDLWREQAASGQAEARSIAGAFAVEQTRRLSSGDLLQASIICPPNRKAWWKFLWLRVSPLRLTQEPLIQA